jgi:tetratricopeptide (TPR) repeat protein
LDIKETLQQALQYLRAGELTEAEEIYREILRIQPNSAIALHFLGVIFYQRKKYDFAIEYIQLALQQQPDYIAALNNLGLVFQAIGQVERALSCFRQSSLIDPNSLESFINMGNLFRAQGLLDEAMECFKKALRLNPHNIELYNNIGNILYAKGLLDEAAAYFKEALRLAPVSCGPYNNLGILLSEKMQFDEAISYFYRAISLNPYFTEAYINLGNTLRAKGSLDEAIECLERASQFTPDAAYVNYNLSLALLAAGDFKRGWQKYEWRRNIADLSYLQTGFAQPLWNGFDLQGSTILLLGEQGFGDTLQFVRYIPLVAERGARVILTCHKELISLLQRMEGLHRVIPYGEQLPDFDTYCNLLSLPFIFGTTIESIPSKVPYISADSLSVQKWRDKIGRHDSRFRIGLVWSGNPRYRRDQQRSLPLKSFSTLAHFENIIFYSLQKGDAAGDAKNAAADLRLVDLTGDIYDFLDTAGFMENLDLVISVDTAVAHLAGALGKEVWVLLPFASDWRWMQGREDSPWYPTMRLFRQPLPGDWEAVVERVKAELEMLLEKHHSIPSLNRTGRE